MLVDATSLLSRVILDINFLLYGVLTPKSFLRAMIISHTAIPEVVLRLT